MYYILSVVINNVMMPGAIGKIIIKKFSIYYYGTYNLIQTNNS